MRPRGETKSRIFGVSMELTLCLLRPLSGLAQSICRLVTIRSLALLTTAFVLLTNGVSAQAPLTLLKDINTYEQNPSTYSSGGPGASITLHLGAYDYFVVNYAVSIESPAQLWRTDGTPEGTQYVMEMGARSLAMAPIATDTHIYWGINNDELWATDGTVAGTHQVMDFNGILPERAIKFRNQLIFSLKTAQTGRELWRSDGTEAGTHIITDLDPGRDDGATYEFVATEEAVIFNGTNGTAYSHLFRTDGTAAGTSAITGRNNSGFSNPYGMVQVNGIVYFIDGERLGRTDGTTEGSYAIAIGQGANTVKPQQLMASGNDLYFFNGTNLGRPVLQLYRWSNGQSQPEMVTELNSYTRTMEMVLYKGKSYFFAWDADHGTELWQSDGTTAGTHMVVDLTPGAANGAQGSVKVGGDYLYYLSPNGQNIRLASYNATTGTTGIIKDFGPATVTASAGALGSNGQGLYFQWSSFKDGSVVYHTQGTAESTTVLRDLGTSHAPATDFTDPWVLYNGYYYFVAHDGEHGQCVWKSDGTTAGTILFKDVHPDTPYGDVANLVVAGNTLYFSERTASNKPTRVWRSDGTPEGTVPHAELIVDGSPAHILIANAVNGALMVCAENWPYGQRQWLAVSRGAETAVPCTPLAIIGVKPIYPAVDDTFGLFTWPSPGVGWELWRTDGTPAGTSMVKDLSPETSATGSATEFRMLLGKYAFGDLYVTDGTSDGTRPFFNCGANCLKGQFSMFEHDGVVYFTGLDATHGWAMYKTDGNTTEFLNDPKPGAVSTGGPFAYVFLNGRILYTNNMTYNDFVGNELWTMDLATGQHQKIYSSPGKITPGTWPVNGRYYFTNSTYQTGTELWSSDGTAEGTRMVRDIQPGEGSSNPKGLTALNGALYFIATSNGRDDLWKTTANGVTKKVTSADGTIGRFYLISDTRMLVEVRNDSNYGNEYFYYDLEDEPAMDPAVAQTIHFEAPAVKKVLDSPFTLGATATSELPVALVVSDPTVIRLEAGQATILRAGQVTITATQEGSEDYLAAEPVIRTITVEKYEQTITFELPALVHEGDAPLLLNATASSGLPVEYAVSEPSIVMVSGAEVTILRQGTVTITASQSGDDIYLEAPPVGATLKVDVVLGIEDNLGPVKAYPNPTTDILIVESKKPVRDITVTDVYGKSITYFRPSETTISLAGVPTGVYVVIITGETFAPVQMKIFKK